jgi:hypothetical protein
MNTYMHIYHDLGDNITTTSSEQEGQDISWRDAEFGIHIYAYISTHVCTFICMYIYEYIYIYIYINIYINIYIYKHTYLYTCRIQPAVWIPGLLLHQLYAILQVFNFSYVYIYVYTYVCKYTYIFITLLCICHVFVLIIDTHSSISITILQMFVCRFSSALSSLICHLFDVHTIV